MFYKITISPIKYKTMILDFSFWTQRNEMPNDKTIPCVLPSQTKGEL